MKRIPHGFSLIEVLIAMAILGILLALAAPSYSTWITNSRIRTTAESIQSGLQSARSEAVRRNSTIRFQLTSSIANDCTLSTTATNWVISYDDPTLATDKCASARLNEAFPAADLTNNPAPRILQLRAASDGTSGVEATADQALIAFNGLGRVVPAPGALVEIDINSPTRGTCTQLKCLRVTVSAGGQVRMCDPNTSLPTTDTQRC